MSFYRVIVRETVSRSQNIEATSLQEARDLAAEDDWRDYTINKEEFNESEIVDVVYLGEDDPLAELNGPARD